MITIEQPVTDRQDAIEGTGKKEKENYAQLGINDEFVISIDKSSYCGHDKTSLGFNFLRPCLAAQVSSCGSSGQFE
jgi:hypothetical protein